MDKTKENTNISNPTTNFNTEENKATISGGRRRRYLSKIKRRILKHVWAVRLGIVALFFVGIYFFILISGFLVNNTSLGFYYDLARDFIFTPDENINSLNGRTNILILGKGGEGHSAPDLTDTIIFSSIDKNTSSVGLVSLSRDIWIPELRAKLNSAYYWGNQKEEGGGLILAKSTSEKITGQPIHYAVVVDFSGFKKIVDALGGIEVGVERSFTDEKYPIPGKENDDCDGDEDYKCRYETIKFGQGTRLMNGERALKFARSRNAEGDEGTDFARAARQEKVMEALRKKALSKEIIINPKKIAEVLKVIRSSIETDMNISELTIVSRLIFDAKDNISSFVLPEELLMSPPKLAKYDFLYVFIPKDESWIGIHEWIKCILGSAACI